MGLNIKGQGVCRWDAASLGEIMLRLDPGDGRIHTAREFKVWEGGGEYNVVRGLRRCVGMKTTAVTAFADNPVGRLVEDFMLQGTPKIALPLAGQIGTTRRYEIGKVTVE